MEKQMIDGISACEPWQYIQGVKDWRLAEILEHYAPGPEGSRVLLPSRLILGCFQELASWLILYSSKFSLAGSLERIDQYGLLKLHVVPDCMRFELWGKFSGQASAIFSGRALMGGETLALMNGLTMSCVAVQNPAFAKECSSSWETLQCFRSSPTD